MGVDGTLENEEAGCAGIERHGNCYQHALARGNTSAYRAEAYTPWNIRGGRPVEIALGIRSREHPGEANVCSILLAIQVSDKAH